MMTVYQEPPHVIVWDTAGISHNFNGLYYCDRATYSGLFLNAYVMDCFGNLVKVDYVYRG